MATIVRHHDDGADYILLGAGYGLYKSSRPSFFFGNLAPTEDSSSYSLVLISDGTGKVGWVRSEDITVVTVDGKAPADLLQAGS